jgi:hypothetical protein
MLIPTSLSEQDDLVYGTLNHDLADVLAERIQDAVTKGLDDLPLFEDEGLTKSKLHDTLIHKFVRNIDVLEAYSAHHVLTLRPFPLAKRKRIVQVFLKGKESLEDISLATDREASSATANIPTRNQLPSQQERTALQDELERLQDRLKKAKLERRNLLLQQRSLQRAEQLSSKVTETLESHHPDTINPANQQVMAAVTDGNSLQELTAEAQTILEKLDRQKRGRTELQEEDNDDDDDPFFAKPMNKHPRLSLEEEYRRQRKQLGLLTDCTNHQNATDTTADGDDKDADSTTAIRPNVILKSLRNLLKPNSSSVVQDSINAKKHQQETSPLVPVLPPRSPPSPNTPNNP